MPQLDDIQLAIEAKDKTKFECRAIVHVAKDGRTFTVSLDDRLYDSARKLESQHRGVTVIWSRGKNRLQVSRLGEATAFLRACAEDHLNCESTTERVIVYSYRLDVCYWRMPDGTLRTNGCNSSSGKWNETSKGPLSSSGHVEHYSIGFAAAVYDKTTHKRSSGLTYTWERVREEQIKDTEHPARRLNSFVRLAVDPEKEHEEMPYTDQAAEFFYGVMMTLCQLGDNLQRFFNDKARLQIAIAKGSRLLPLSTPANS